ncbi:MAG: type II toxin-antitoxin system Phd/YefM family antitoxin [Pseudomonadota bacterium]
MKLAESIKPISYLKAHTADVVRSVSETLEPVIITQNGEAKAVVQDISSYEQTQEALALLKLLAQSKSSVDAGESRSLRSAVKDIRRDLRKSDR